MNVKRSQLSISIEQSMKGERRTKEHTRTPNPFETSGYAFPNLVWYSMEQKQAPELFRTTAITPCLYPHSLYSHLFSFPSLFLSLAFFRVFRQFGNAGAPMLLFLFQQMLGISQSILRKTWLNTGTSSAKPALRFNCSRKGTKNSHFICTSIQKSIVWLLLIERCAQGLNHRVA